MRNAIIALFLVMLFSSFSLAQKKTVGVHTGILISAFEDQDESATAIPLGANFAMEVAENIEVGGEVNFLISGFEFESEIFGTTITSTFGQTAFGAFGRYNFPISNLSGYARLGIGYYTGSVESEGGGQSQDTDYEGAVGFNLGAGVKTEMGLYGELIYTIVTQEFDGGGELDVNNWGLQVGYNIALD